MRRVSVVVTTLLLSACAATAPAQTLTPGPLTVTAAPGAPDARIYVEGPEAFVILKSTDTDPAKELPYVAFKPDLLGNMRKVGVLAFQFPDPDPVKGFGTWNLHSTQLVNGTGTDTFQLFGCAGRRLAVFPFSIAPDHCPAEGWFHVNGNQRIAENLQVDGDIQGKTIAALEARIAALEAKLAGTVATQPQPGPPPPAPGMITCPGSHPACRVLPAGTYSKAWADVIVR